jgi:hypothetical protein
VRLDVELGGAPQTISQSIGGRFRRKPDYAVRRLPWTVAFPEEGRPRLSADLEGFIPRAPEISTAALTL